MHKQALIQYLLLLGDSALVQGQRLCEWCGKAPALGLWSLPGGRIEPGEALQEAVLRELFEEVGIKAQVLGFVDHVEHIARNEAGEITAHAVICAYAGRWLAGEPQLTEEATALAWVDPFNPPDLPMTRRLPLRFASLKTRTSRSSIW